MKKLAVLIMVLMSVFLMQGIAFAEENQMLNPVEEAITLTEDTIWTGDYYVTEDVDLKGFTLTVTGNLILSDGTMKLQGGKLLVDGDFRIQGIKKDRKGIPYQQMKEEDFQFCNGSLRMDQVEDYILVKGNFYPNGKNTTLRNGTVELKGDFLYTTGAYMGCYDAIGEHKTIFSGDSDQRVYFSRSGSQFNILEIHKTSGKMLFESTIDIAAIDEDTTIPVGGNGYLYLYLYTNKNLSLQGHHLTIDGTLFFERGSLSLDGGSLTVNEDLRIEKIRNLDKIIDTNLSQLEEEDFIANGQDTQLVMKSDKEKIMVMGSFIVNNYKAFDKLRAGTIEIKGDVIQKKSKSMFVASGTNRVILSGTKRQTVSFEHPSYQDNRSGKVTIYSNFNILELQNRYVYFTTEFKTASYRSIYWYKKLIPLDLNVNYDGEEIKFKKYSPVIFNGDIYIELNEVNQMLGTKLSYSSKKSIIDGNYGKIAVSVKAITINKNRYVNIENLLDKMKLDYQYDAETKTFTIVK